MIIFGINAVIEAVKASKNITKVFIQRDINKKSTEQLISKLENSKIPYSYVPIQKLNKITLHNHQGVIAQLSEITFHFLEEVVETNKSRWRRYQYPFSKPSVSGIELSHLAYR